MSRPNQAPELTTTRIGGGRSTLLIALGVAAVLIGFVAIGIAGRPAPPPPVAVATAPPSAVPPTRASPPPSPLPTSPSVATIAQIRSDESSPRPNEFLGTVLTVAGEVFIAELEEVEPGRFYAAYRIPFPRLAREASLAIAEFTETANDAGWTSLGDWQITLDPIAPERREAAKVLDTIQLPRFEPGGSSMERSGFSVTVYAEGRLNFGLLTIDVQRGAERPYPDESYAVDARVGDFATRVELAGIGPAHFSGMLIIPDWVTDTELDITLVAMPARNPLLGMATVDEYTLNLPDHGRFADGSGVSSSNGPQEIEPGMSELLTFGHQFVAQTTYSGFQRAVVFDLQIFGGIDKGTPLARWDRSRSVDISWHPRHRDRPTR